MLAVAIITVAIKAQWHDNNCHSKHGLIHKLPVATCFVVMFLWH